MAVQISGNDITVPRDGTFTRNVTIGGTLTYEDVTNIDSVGLITARNGIEVGASPGVAASISVDGNAIFSGITTIGGNIKVGTGVTISPDGDAFFTGVVTATSYSGIDLGAVTGATGDFSIADKIVHTGDTNTAIRFPAADTVSVETGGSERARINSDGQLLVGTTETSPYANRTLMTNKNGGNYVSVTTDSSNDCGIVFGDGTANNSANYESYIAHSNSTNDFTINVNQGNDSRHLKVKSTGNVEIGNGNLVLADGHGIDFSAASGSASGSTSALLDDYEEGTYTPFILNGFDPSIASNTGAYSQQNGYYRKIGTLVEFNFYINIHNSQRETDGGHLKVSLPFTQDYANQKRGHGFLTYNTFTALNVGSNGIGIYIYDSKAELYSGSTAVSGGNGDSQANRYLIGGGHFHTT